MGEMVNLGERRPVVGRRIYAVCRLRAGLMANGMRRFLALQSLLDCGAIDGSVSQTSDVLVKGVAKKSAKSPRRTGVQHGCSGTADLGAISCGQSASLDCGHKAGQGSRASFARALGIGLLWSCGLLPLLPIAAESEASGGGCVPG